MYECIYLILFDNYAKQKHNSMHTLFIYRFRLYLFVMIVRILKTLLQSCVDTYNSHTTAL